MNLRLVFSTRTGTTMQPSVEPNASPEGHNANVLTTNTGISF